VADVTYPYVPVDGVAFNVNGWNSDMRSTTAGASVYGELNGNLEDANFAAGAKLTAREFKPNDLHLGVSGGEEVERVYYDSLFGQAAIGAAGDTDWLAVAGTAHRVYLPWAAAVLICNVSAFVTVLRQRETTDPNPAVEVAGGPELYVRMAVDGTPIGHTRRPFPYTWYPAVNPGNAGTEVAREQVLTQHLDLVHMITNPAVGWHSVRLECLIPRTQGRELLVPLYRTAGNVEHFIRHRLRFGVRSARILAL